MYDAGVRRAPGLPGQRRRRTTDRAIRPSHESVSPNMTKTLILMRHAKSSWDNPDLSDHDRKLNKRGKTLGRGPWAIGCDRRAGCRIRCSVPPPCAPAKPWPRLGAGVPDRVHRRPVPRHRQPDAAGSVAGHRRYGADAGAQPGDHRSSPKPSWRSRPNTRSSATIPTGATLVVQFDLDDWDRRRLARRRVRISSCRAS